MYENTIKKTIIQQPGGTTLVQYAPPTDSQSLAQSSGTTLAQHTLTPRTESQVLKPEGLLFIKNFLGQALQLTQEVKGEVARFLKNFTRIDNKYFSSLKIPSEKAIAELMKEAAKIAEAEKTKDSAEKAIAELLKEAARVAEAERKKNLEEVEATKQAVNHMPIDADIKREMIAELNRAYNSPNGLPPSMAGMALIRYAKQGEDKVVQEFKDAKA